MAEKRTKSTGEKCYISLLSEPILEQIFCYLKLSDVGHCLSVCKWWYLILCNENSIVWRLLCEKMLDEGRDDAMDLVDKIATYKAKLRAFGYAWNPKDCSKNSYIRRRFLFHRNPIAQSTDCARGKCGFDSGRHMWEIRWYGPLGTVAVIGISTKEASLQCNGYTPLIGSDVNSWGWNLVDQQLLHDNNEIGTYPKIFNTNNTPSVTVTNITTEKFKVILDCEDCTLSFERGDDFLGIAFKDLPKKRFYPAVAAVYGNTEVRMIYLGPPLDG